MRKILISAAVIALCGASAASAQTWQRSSAFGGVTLEAGFSPDPHSVNLTAGGSISASQRFTNCQGYIADAPDYSVRFDGGVLPLTVSADSDIDTTLIINGPQGNWFCDDDGGEGLNPAYTFENPQSGRYDIWVGTYSSGSGVPATLFISELGAQTRESAGTGRITANTGNSGSRITANTGSSASLNISAAADVNIDLSGGFYPDPHQRPVMAGGNTSLSSAVPSASCAGYADSAPTAEIDYDGSGTLYIYTEGSVDTTLAVNDSNGNWHCNDDGASGTNAGLALTSGFGTFDVYVGRFSQGREATTLSISEIAIDY
jgi:hypothetical protein